MNIKSLYPIPPHGIENNNHHHINSTLINIDAIEKVEIYLGRESGITGDYGGSYQREHLIIKLHLISKTVHTVSWEWYSRFSSFFEKEKELTPEEEKIDDAKDTLHKNSVLNNAKEQLDWLFGQGSWKAFDLPVIPQKELSEAQRVLDDYLKKERPHETV